MARILNKPDHIQSLEELRMKIWNSFQNEFVTPNGRLSSDTQTAYLLALRYNLLPDELRLNAANYLQNRVNQLGHLTTGFLGTPHLNHVLSEFGFWEEAYNLLLRENYPSWLYPITMGATTIWERWDGIKPDSTFQRPGMNSLNHYAYGAIGEWMVKEVAGIKSNSPGYQSLNIAPHPGGGLRHARAIQHTLYGKVASSWYFEDNDFVLRVEVPANSYAAVRLPFAQTTDIRVNNSKLLQNNDIKGFDVSDGQLLVDIGSGIYEFRVPKEWFPESARPGEAPETKEGPYGVKTKVARLLAHDATRTILFEEMPALMQSPWLSQVMNFSLERAMECLPEDLTISNTRIREVNNRLKREE